MVAASVLGLPQPDGNYKIPQVGNNRRSQYYVLHEDGSHKYGYDTGDNAFESLKTDSDGEVKGKFGYTDSDGQDFRVQYTSGSGGFVAQGDHIPKVHPDVAAAFAAARAAGPFVDPLAGVDADRSFNFGFDGEEYSRNEVSNSDGTVTGSYSYIDEFGNTKTYTYRAGKGIGFEIIGDDIPKPVEPLPSHTAIAQFRATGASSANRGASSSFSAVNRGATSSFSAGNRAAGSSFSAGNRAAPSSVSAGSRSTSVPWEHKLSTTRESLGSASISGHQQSFNNPSSTHTNRAASFSSTHQSSGVQSQRAPSRIRTGTTGAAGQFEAANTRLSISPQGSYSLAYETSSHSRQETGDDDNSVRGRFTFTADDDDEDRTVTYEAGAATGFIAEGAHLPIGPSVPGASSGQVTGRLEPVEEIEFNDPLADDDSDSSYNFNFDSDLYSRSETADEDGNIVGTYSVLGEDNILRTYRFRAGKGIGYEVEEISAVPSRARVSTSTTSQSGSFSHSGSGSSSNTRLSHGTSASVKASSGAFSGHGSGATAFSSSSNAGSAFTSPQLSAHSSRASAQSTFSANTRSSAVRPVTSQNFASTRLASFRNDDDDDDDFTLYQYHPSEGRGKYGYVLKFD